MNFFIFWEPRAGPKNSLWGNTYSFLFGSNTSGKTVNERTAIQSTAVYDCIIILAEIIASLPLQTHKYTENGKEKTVLQVLKSGWTSINSSILVSIY